MSFPESSFKFLKLSCGEGGSVALRLLRRQDAVIQRRRVDVTVVVVGTSLGAGGEGWHGTGVVV